MSPKSIGCDKLLRRALSGDASRWRDGLKEYDATARVTATMDPSSGRSGFGYDALGRGAGLADSEATTDARPTAPDPFAL